MTYLSAYIITFLFVIFTAYGVVSAVADLATFIVNRVDK